MSSIPEIHVFDLLQIYQKPSSTDLLDALALLTTAPPSWQGSDTEDDTNLHSAGKRTSIARKTGRVNPQGITRYLTSIVSSDLWWIEDEDAQDEIWSQASLRLSERSGRSAMPAMSRAFRIPLKNGESIELIIHEPALTADNLGLKTWASSYLLSKRLCALDLPILTKSDSAEPQILELGSGTGLVGLAAACVYGSGVVLTDLPSIVPNLLNNIQKNRDIIEQNDGFVQGGILDWMEPTSCHLLSDETSSLEETGVISGRKFPVIVAADSLYSPEHPRMLVDTIKIWLSDDENARVVVEFPFREGYLAELNDFRERMKIIGLEVLQEGKESGRDDWGWGCGENVEAPDEAVVICWWSVWGRHGRETKVGNPSPS